MKWLAALFLVFPGIVLAQDAPTLTEVVKDSNGYVHIRPGVVLIEGDALRTRICRIDVSDEDFAAYAEGQTDHLDSSNIVCILTKEFDE